VVVLLQEVAATSIRSRRQSSRAGKVVGLAVLAVCYTGARPPVSVVPFGGLVNGADKARL